MFWCCVALALPVSEAQVFSVEQSYFQGYDVAEISALLSVPSGGSLAVVLYHGVTATKETMLEFAAAANGSIVLAYDHRSRGKSTRGFTWEGMVGDSKLEILRARNDIVTESFS